MPHQDNDNLCTPLQDLKSLLELFPADQLHDQPRHGNASINPVVLAVTAFVTFGWTKKDSLTDRFHTACDAARRLFPNKTLATTRQGRFSALGQCGAQLLKLIRAELIE